MKKNINLIVNGVKPEKVMYDTDNHSLIVLYPAQEEFKKGDILASDDALLIFDKYKIFNQEKDLFHSIWNNIGGPNNYWISKYFTYATDEQKAQLHEELAKEGKKWNAETLEIEDLDISDIVYNLSSACSYLNKPVPDFKSLLLTISNEDFHKYKAQITLQLIREAWNKFDGFEVDWKNTAQQKYYPQVYVLDEYKNKISTANWITYASADSSCYYFESRERAKQFGNQFKELFKTAMGI